MVIPWHVSVRGNNADMAIKEPCYVFLVTIPSVQNGTKTNVSCWVQTGLQTPFLLGQQVHRSTTLKQLVFNNKELCRSPWMLRACPSLRAAPLTLHRVLTIRSALASDRKGLESRTAFLFSPKKTKNKTILNGFFIDKGLKQRIVFHISKIYIYTYI